MTEAGQTELGAAADVAKKLTDETAAAAFAVNVAKYLQNPTESKPGAVGYTISDLAAGYYLVKDKDNTLTDVDDGYTAYMMKVVGNISAKPKADKPTLDIKITHNDMGTDDYDVVGDDAIGGTPFFRITTSVPDITGYEEYTYTIHVKISKGLTYNGNYYLQISKPYEKGDYVDSLNKSDYKGKYVTVGDPETDADGITSLDITIDVKALIDDKKVVAGDTLWTAYSCQLNGDAKPYTEGSETNTAYLEYSNNPSDTTSKGKTAEKTVYDWTYQISLNKVNGDGAALTGAKFVISQAYNLNIDELECDENGTPQNPNNLMGWVYVKTNDKGIKVYRYATQADKEDASKNVVYALEAGSVVVYGLDDSTNGYYLYETKAPQGYNVLKTPVKFNITAKYSTDGSKLELNYPTVTIYHEDDKDTTTTDTNMTVSVVNQTGTTLPETGGMGTTVIYVLGALLAVGAGILLITRKRMSKTQG